MINFLTTSRLDTLRLSYQPEKRERLFATLHQNTRIPFFMLEKSMSNIRVWIVPCIVRELIAISAYKG